MLWGTSLLVFVGMAVSLWLAAYLLARGFSSRVTLRAVLVLVMIAAYYFSAYINIQQNQPGSSLWRAFFLSTGVVLWHH